MRETLLSLSERKFLIESIQQNLRLDGRKCDEFRGIKINFGLDFGSVVVSLGETKVLAVVSCELGEPKATRPNEGMIYINVDLGSMAAPHFETGRNSELTVQINRTLERTFKDSRCVDLESLCVTAEEHVWILRIDLCALNHDGNLIDCCSIATLCALAHFRRPDVSVIDNSLHIHTADEKEPIGVVLHHYPVCVSYVTMNDGTIAVADPTYNEERSADSSMVFGMNSFRELCCLNLGGKSLTNAYLLIQSSQRAAARAKWIVDQVKKALEEEKQLRETNAKIGYTECVRLNKITSLAEDRLALRLRDFKFFASGMDVDESVGADPTIKQEMIELEENVENRFEEQPNIDEVNEEEIRWVPEYNDESEDYDTENVETDNETDEDLANDVDEALKNTKDRTNQPISKHKRFEDKF